MIVVRNAPTSRLSRSAHSNPSRMLANIDDEGLVERAAELGALALARLQEIAHGHPAVAEVRGRGLLLGVELADHGDTTLEVVARATPRGDLSAQRIGLCLLHPLSAAGGAVEIEHVDGRLSRSTLPTRVSPWPPFTLVRQVRHEYQPGHWACARLEGDGAADGFATTFFGFFTFLFFGLLSPTSDLQRCCGDRVG